MRILVAGASGFVGRNLLLGLPRAWQVVATYHRSLDFVDFIARHELANRVDARQVDLAEAPDVARLAETGAAYDACIFLAANGDPARSVGQPAFDLRSNTLSLVHLLEHVAVRRLILFSSGAVYDGLRGQVGPESVVAPLLPYAISKLASERYAKHFVSVGRVEQAAIVRFFGAYGPYEPERKIFTRLVRRFALERDARFTIRGDGANLIDAMHVDDAVRAIQLLLTGDECPEIVDLAARQPLTLRDLVSQAGSIFGLAAEITTDGRVPEYIEFQSVDTTMRDQFAFEPRISLPVGLQALAEHLRADASRGPRQATLTAAHGTS